MLLIRYLLLIIFLIGLPEIFDDNLQFVAISNNSYSQISERHSMFSSESNRLRPPFIDRMRPLRPSRRALHMKKGFEAGIIIGTSHQLSDIGTGMYSFMGTHWETTDLNAGVFGRYHFNDRWAINSSFHYARIHAADSLAPKESARYKRDFYYNNQIFELNVKAEFYIPRILEDYPFRIYGFLGAAVFYHNPDLTVPDPENFEKESYGLIQPAIPMGLGILYFYNDNIRIGLDIGHRVLFTDYLDGFTRPAGPRNDAYFFGSLKISYFFGPQRYTPY